ncbi:uncharacterized protein B0H64DRAFT_375460 [Chaetomium fimeti]|uniref:Uncharacterized protein n=1 Tax=Chaetomium fimeti TaxID=1854472 RepID=A0AAE0HDV9_9PEZI|nr:hypothetical protein B0H64DRAFT_375460 [Chaetomium fimeti]
MARSTGLLALLGAFASAALAETTTTSASNVFNLFVIDPTGPVATPVVQASVISVDPDLLQTAYWITCEIRGGEFQGRPLPAPCNYVGGASVTINPTAMTLNVRRGSQVVSVDPATGASDGATTRETIITVTATATCDIHGSTSASCTGHMTSRSAVSTHHAGQADGTDGTATPTTIDNSGPRSTAWDGTSTETISTRFADVAAHRIPVTVTAGLEKLEAAASSTGATVAGTSSSTGAAAARATPGGGSGLTPESKNEGRASVREPVGWYARNCFGHDAQIHQKDS